MATIIDDKRVQVWDPLVRIGHWALAVAFTIAYFSGESGRERSDLHELAGYAAGGIVAWRVVWGLSGPKYARFQHFVTGPKEAIRYLLELTAGSARRYVGHNPAGAAMIIALLGSIGLTVLTGVLTNRGRPPLAQAALVIVAENNGVNLSKENQRLDGENVFGKIHGVLANITAALVVIHILGVVLACLAHWENLVTAMITGRKRPADPTQESSS
jgi:cytochrome b